MTECTLPRLFYDYEHIVLVQRFMSMCNQQSISSECRHCGSSRGRKSLMDTGIGSRRSTLSARLAAKANVNHIMTSLPVRIYFRYVSPRPMSSSSRPTHTKSKRQVSTTWSWSPVLITLARSSDSRSRFVSSRSSRIERVSHLK